jgi:hypothetical protein
MSEAPEDPILRIGFAYHEAGQRMFNSASRMQSKMASGTRTGAGGLEVVDLGQQHDLFRCWL